MTTSCSFASLIGREQALLEVRAQIERSRSRREVPVVRISAPPGLGKTAFLRCALTELRYGDVAFASALPADAAQPGACAGRLAASVSESADDADVENVLGHVGTICVDDTQWIDEMSVRSIIRAIRTGNVVFALFADRRQDAPELIAHHTVRLEPLDEMRSALVVRGRYPAAPREVVAEIVRASAGSPFGLALLADEAARRDARSRGETPSSVNATIGNRLDRAELPAKEALRLCALLQGVADLRAIARACAVSVEDAARFAAGFIDLIDVHGTAATFRHDLVRESVASTVSEPLTAYRRLLNAYLHVERATDRDAAVLHCALGCGDNDVAAAYALNIGRRSAASGASSTALSFFETALRHAPSPPPSEYAVEYATALQHLAREVDAASFLRNELQNAIERADANRASDLLASFSSVALTLERDAEFNDFCDRVAAMPRFTERDAARLQTARLAVLAFSGRFDEYSEVAVRRPPARADHRIAAFVAATDGDADGAKTSFQRYQAQLRSTDLRQEPADRVLQAVVTLNAVGNHAIADIEDVATESHASDAYQGIAHVRIATRIHDGRWDDARTLLTEFPLWDPRYNESYQILDARLELDALQRQVPLQNERTREAIWKLIAQGQMRHAVSPARWYVAAVERAGGAKDAQLSGFVGETLAVAPMPYPMTSLPLALALIAPQYGKAHCLAALRKWPQLGSAWHRAQYSLAFAMLTRDEDHLREVRNVFRRLGAPAFATIAGLSLPLPSRNDIEHGRRLGFLAFEEAPTPKPSLTKREWQVGRLVTDGCTDVQIATHLHIAVRTVEEHLRHSFDKIGVRRRSALARYVVENDPDR